MQKKDSAYMQKKMTKKKMIIFACVNLANNYFLSTF